MKNEFHIVLPSDSSMDYSPENTATRFCTTLPNHIQLSGEWAVALKEIQFPCNFYHIRDKKDGEVAFSITTIKDGKPSEPVRQTSFIPRGFYANINDLIEALNAVPQFNHHYKFTYEKGTSMVTVSLKCLASTTPSACKEKWHSIWLSDRIVTILGFKLNWYFDKNTSWPYTQGGPVRELIGASPSSLTRAIPHNLFVYSDICTPYITGDVNSSLLRIVPCNTEGYTYGSYRTVTFGNLNYIPLLSNSFRTIDIDIRDSEGKPIPFEYGPLNVTLHFKRVD